MSIFFLRVTNFLRNFVGIKRQNIYHIHRIYILFLYSQPFPLVKQIIFVCTIYKTLISDSPYQAATIKHKTIISKHNALQLLYVSNTRHCNYILPPMFNINVNNNSKQKNETHIQTNSTKC